VSGVEDPNDLTRRIKQSRKAASGGLGSRFGTCGRF